MKKLLLLLLLLPSIALFASENDSTIRILIVTAHPDDEGAFSATIYKITHEQKGIADIAIITNGEGGYKYSLLAEPYYHLKLTDEAIGRKYLPEIRQKEMRAAGNIIGIRNYYFFNQLDNHYTLDVDTVLKQVWDVPMIKKKLTKIIEKGDYDFIFCLLPSEDTHGHHKGATILALEVVSELKGKRPIVFGASTSSKSDTIAEVFRGLQNYPLTNVSDSLSAFTVDRTQSFGYKNQLSYRIIVNWEMAEHKSQGTVQNYLRRGDFENFWYFDMNGKDGREKAKKMFERLNDFKYK